MKLKKYYICMLGLELLRKEWWLDTYVFFFFFLTVPIIGVFNKYFRVNYGNFLIFGFGLFRKFGNIWWVDRNHPYNMEKLYPDCRFWSSAKNGAKYEFSNGFTNQCVKVVSIILRLLRSMNRIEKTLYTARIYKLLLFISWGLFLIRSVGAWADLSKG